MSAAEQLKNFRPTMPARRYRPKEDGEKSDPSYKLKRARNNDAVRKSRNKAKEAQMQKDDEIAKLRGENSLMRQKLERAEATIKRLQKQLGQRA